MASTEDTDLEENIRYIDKANYDGKHAQSWENLA